MSENKKKLEIVAGKIEDLNLSPVSEHIKPAKPKNKKNSNNIVIPHEQKK
jgi:hypothetical protein